MPSSSLFLRSCTTLVSALLLSVSSASSNQYYAIDSTYQGPTFFDGFSFFSAADPTHGFVDYLSRSDALNTNLISYGIAQPAKMKVDASTPLTPPQDVSEYYNKDGVGRKSVRIESVKTWTHGLIILDIDHMPTSATDGCGTWPAFWTLGSGTWPQNGEMDIIEGANDQVKNFAAGHTGSADKSRQCTVANNGGNGDLIYSNCNLYSTDPWGNPTNPSGCKIQDKTAASYGKPFNDNKGGVYAMEWTSEYIKTYVFPRGRIPTDIGAGTRAPSKWPAPFGVFSTPCDIGSNYNNMQIISDTTFCGDFGDATWGSSCAAKTGFDTCAKYVASKPQDFAEAYWQIESLKVYTLKDKPVNTSSTSTTLSTTTRSTTTTATTSSYSTRSSSSTSSPTRSSSSSSSSSTTTSSYTRSSTTTSSSSSTATSTRSSSTTLCSSSTSTPSPRTSISRSSTVSTTSNTTYSSTPSASTSASSNRYISSSLSSSPYLSSRTSTSPSTISKSDSVLSSSTYATSSTWVDWSVDPALATTTTTLSSTTSSAIQEDRSLSTSSTPAASTSSTTSTTSDRSHTCADRSSSSTASVASTSKPTTTAHDPSTAWADWKVSASTNALASSAAGVGGQYYPVSNASSNSGSWGPPGASVGLTPMTVQPMPSVVAEVTQVWGGAMGGSASAHASATGSKPVGYGGSTSSPSGVGNPVAPSIATYTANGAVRTGLSIPAVALLAGAMIRVL